MCVVIGCFHPKNVIGHFSTVAVALGGLTIWHAVLISRGETSIERHINNKEAERMAKHGKVSIHTPLVLKLVDTSYLNCILLFLPGVQEPL